MSKNEQFSHEPDRLLAFHNRPGRHKTVTRVGYLKRAEGAVYWMAEQLNLMN